MTKVGERENLTEGQSKYYGSAEQIEDGAWRLGNFLVIAVSMETGIMVSGQTEGGVEVTMSLSAQETLQLADLALAHRPELEDGFRKFAAIAPSFSSVVIDTGVREPIPMNRSVSRHNRDGVTDA